MEVYIFPQKPCPNLKIARWRASGLEFEGSRFFSKWSQMLVSSSPNHAVDESECNIPRQRMVWWSGDDVLDPAIMEASLQWWNDAGSWCPQGTVTEQIKEMRYSQDQARVLACWNDKSSPTSRCCISAPFKAESISWAPYNAKQCWWLHQGKFTAT